MAAAEDLPFDDGAFDAALAQLVVSFMSDPVAGLGEMRRVTRAGGIVAACVWDHAGGQAPLAPFWRAVAELDPGARDESALAGASEGQLAGLFASAGLDDVEDDALSVRVEHASFEEWWEPFTLGVGPVGAYLAGLDADAGPTCANDAAGSWRRPVQPRDARVGGPRPGLGPSSAAAIGSAGHSITGGRAR